ncbi:O-acyltransferase like protein [Drosophila eugracilis]|uniref:O-acyltransferase like protein n=1 Tax=Drosophila eugracilis TaxID=29029 RepID=UPI0007E7B736|nr:O-acyltransferase like protein [Drosophila eugracilis]
MIRLAGTVLIIWLAVAKGALPTQNILSQENEVSFVANHERLMDLRSLGMEFFREFRNMSATDLHLLGERYDAQDLICLADMANFMTALTTPKKWALTMLDSWGSIPAGYLYGNIVDMGNYDECLKTDGTISDSHQIKGKYCFLELPIYKWLGYTTPLLAMTNMKTAVCFPSSCSANTMEKFFEQLLQRLLAISDPSDSFSISEQTCRTNESESFDGLTICTIVLLSIFCTTVILCTLYDYFLCPEQGKLPSFVKAFSARATSRDLFTIVDNKMNPNVIHCLNGMRCMSLVWVIFGHEYIVALKAPAINPRDNLKWMTQPFTNFILYAPFSVDTFFFISGLLLVAIGLRSLEKTKGKLNVPLMYLHRYLRLTPILAVAILVYVKMIPIFADGPLYGSTGFFDYSICDNTWYLTLLYVQNYATDNICLGHSWYLAVDMQLFILSPILLIGLFKWGKKAAAGILLLILLTSACLFATIVTNNYGVIFSDGSHIPEVQKKIYYATHTHAAPWLIGILFGYFLHLIRGRNFQLNRLVVWTGWFLCLAMLFTSIFAMYPYAKLLGKSPTVLEGAFYYTLTRIGWPLALCWVVFACIQGYGGLANSFLSSPLWQPLSKISYSAYIWHIFIQEVNHKRVRTHTYFSDFEVMLSFWSTFGFTLVMSYVLYVIIEAPLDGVERMMFPNRRPSPVPAVKDEQAKIEPNAEIIDRHEVDPDKQTDLEQANPKLVTKSAEKADES